MKFLNVYGKCIAGPDVVLLERVRFPNFEAVAATH
jgi:hypothetical protein